MSPFLLHTAARKHPDTIALDAGFQQWTWVELNQRTTQLARYWRQEGLESGQRVILYGDLSAGKVLLFWSLVRAGCIVAPVSERFAEAERAELLRPLTPAAVVVERGKWSGSSPAPLFFWDTALRASLALPADFAEDHDDEHLPATLIWTSGSSSRPKAALHSLFNHLQSARGSGQNLLLKPGDRWLLSLPVVHVAGIAILCRCAVSGATVVLPEAGIPLSEQLLLTEPTHLSLVPTQLQRLLQAGDEVVERLQKTKAILLGGSAIPASLLREADRMGLPVYTSYGSTEMSSQITTTGPGSTLEQRLNSAGWLLPHRELCLDDEGAVCVKGDTLFLGYWEEGGLRHPVNKQGWLVTRDRGCWNEDGSLRILGRLDNMMISGGENIQPEEIEGILQQHPHVSQALVVAVQDEVYGHRPAAFVQWREEGEGSVEGLRGFLGQHLARFKIPDHFLNWPTEAMMTGFKVHRASFQALAEESLAQTRMDCDKKRA